MKEQELNELISMVNNKKVLSTATIHLQYEVNDKEYREDIILCKSDLLKILKSKSIELSHEQLQEVRFLNELLQTSESTSGFVYTKEDKVKIKEKLMTILF